MSSTAAKEHLHYHSHCNSIMETKLFPHKMNYKCKMLQPAKKLTTTKYCYQY